MPEETQPTGFVPRVEFTFNFEKFLAAVKYLAIKDVPELDKYKIGKLLFLADKYHVVKYGRPIIGDRYCALPHGPVPSGSLDLLNVFLRLFGQETNSPEIRLMRENLELDTRYQHARFMAKGPVAFHVLSKSDVMVLDHIIEKFGRKGFSELKSLTHTMFAYRQAWEAAPNSEMRYEDFFEEDADSIVGAREEMLENDAIRRAFPAK